MGMEIGMIMGIGISRELCKDIVYVHVYIWRRYFLAIICNCAYKYIYMTLLYIIATCTCTYL